MYFEKFRKRLLLGNSKKVASEGGGDNLISFNRSYGQAKPKTILKR